MGIFCFSKAPHFSGGVIYSRVTMYEGKPSEGKAIISFERVEDNVFFQQLQMHCELVFS